MNKKVLRSKGNWRVLGDVMYELQEPLHIENISWFPPIMIMLMISIVEIAIFFF